MMAVSRASLEEHIRINDLGNGTQAGFTERSRIENNLLLLRYCIEGIYKRRNPFIVLIR